MPHEAYSSLAQIVQGMSDSRPAFQFVAAAGKLILMLGFLYVFLSCAGII